MSCTYAFNITGWSHVYVREDEYAKNRFKYLAQHCPAVFLKFEYSAYKDLAEKFLKETDSSLRKRQISSFKITYPQGLVLFLFDWVEFLSHEFSSPTCLIMNDPRRCTFLLLRSYSLAKDLEMKSFIYGYPNGGFRLCPVKPITRKVDPHSDDTELILSSQALAERSWTEDDLIRTLLGLDSRDEIQISL